MDQTLFDPCVVQNPVPRDKPAIFNYLVSVYPFPNWGFLAIFKKTRIGITDKIIKKILNNSVTYTVRFTRTLKLMEWKTS